MIQYLDIPKATVVDWMHNVLLGVTKALLTFWINSKYKDRDFFLLVTRYFNCFIFFKLKKKHLEMSNSLSKLNMWEVVIFIIYKQALQIFQKNILHHCMLTLGRVIIHKIAINN